jgi:two-component system, NarL family, response regulator NreC
MVRELAGGGSSEYRRGNVKGEAVRHERLMEGASTLDASNEEAQTNGGVVAAHRVRLFLAADYAMVRAGIRSILRVASEVDVVGEGEDDQEIIEAVARLQPDVVLLAMTDGSAISYVESILSQTSSPLLVVTMDDQVRHARDILSLGIAGFLVGTAGPDELVCAIRAVSRGYSFISAPLPARGGMAKLFDARGEGGLDGPSPRAELARTASLTAREREVLGWMAEGCTNREIAEHLALSPKTIEAYRTRLSDKTGLKRRSELVRLALSVGLTKCGPSATSREKTHLGRAPMAK